MNKVWKQNLKETYRLKLFGVQTHCVQIQRFHEKRLGSPC